MINNSLTVKIEDDLFQTTGKRAPNVANRFGVSGNSSPGKNRSPTATKKPTNSLRNSYQPKTASKRFQDPIDLRLHSEFGISLGNKLFKNEKFDRKIQDVQAKIDALKRTSHTDYKAQRN